MARISKRYIVWNGSVQRPLVENDLSYCVVTNDLGTISLRELKRMTRDGTETVYLFGCKPRGSCISTGRGGVFSLAFANQFALWKTLRDLVSDINEDAVASGYEQRAEVICRADLLDVPIENL